ncbi:unnamed protein product [Ambrosiozyma monospora]|uniref:Unnamed protein product n=1 Tax=Ambrosiozyma monospora TaxID=43982 RepID=A0ACB5U7B8_AMBMO|nr:unnamed protein product [Ambrosiozyma monospora]
MLRQQPWENLISFICSTNNNVKRISKMCESLCVNYGTLIEVPESMSDHTGVKLEMSADPLPYYTFPLPDSLASPSVEEELRQLGFGYRAKFIQQTAAMVSKDPALLQKLTLSSVPIFSSETSGTTENENQQLREMPYEECKEFLLQFKGVGPKVADCVALMSLDKHDIVPVDTHVYQIALRDYKFRSKAKSKAKGKARGGSSRAKETGTISKDFVRC